MPRSVYEIVTTSTVEQPVDGIEDGLGSGNRWISAAHDGAPDQFVATLMHLGQSDTQIPQV